MDALWQQLPAFVDTDFQTLVLRLAKLSGYPPQLLTSNTKAFDDCHICRMPQLALEVHHRDSRILRVFLYNPGIYLTFYAKHSPSQLQSFYFRSREQIGRTRLPFGFSWKHTGRSLVEFFGEPDIKRSNKNSSFIRLGYSQLGVEFELDSKTWQNPDCRINMIVLFSVAPGSVLPPRKCFLCQKGVEKPAICDGCGVVWYCGSDCRERHKITHQVHCKSLKK